MRHKFKNNPRLGDVRYKTKFLFFPKIINNELRWFEWASWKEEFIETYSLADDCVFYQSWKPIEWDRWY